MLLGSFVLSWSDLVNSVLKSHTTSVITIFIVFVAAGRLSESGALEGNGKHS